MLSRRNWIKMCSALWLAAMMITKVVTINCQILSKSEGYLVSSDAWGGLVYKPMSNGDTIMDFSSVGYRGKDAPFPSVPVMKTLCPSGGDDSDQIQAGINEVSALPLDENGLRGAVKLSPGIFNVGGRSITIVDSGVVLQGSGVSPETGTVLNAHNLSASVLFQVGKYGETQGVGRSAIITHTVPSGSKLLIVDSSEGFNVGDRVQVFWPWTKRWIDMMRMTQIWRNRASTVVTIERVLSNVSDHMLTLDIPVPFRVDQQYLGGDRVARVQLMKLPVENRISNVAIQDLMAVKDPTPPYGAGSFVQTVNVEDAWLSNMVVVDFGGTLPTNISGTQSTVWISGSRITVERLNLTRTIPAPSIGAKPFDIALENPAQQILVRNTHVAGDHQISLLTNNGVQGPNVFYNCTSSGKNHAQPHSFFATGLLFDNVEMDMQQGSLEVINRGDLGSGHGYAAGYSVAYNCKASMFTVISPPGAYNWALGCNAQSMNQDSEFLTGEEVGVIGQIDPFIPSLYQAQRLIQQTDIVRSLGSSKFAIQSWAIMALVFLLSWNLLASMF